MFAPKSTKPQVKAATALTPSPARKHSLQPGVGNQATLAHFAQEVLRGPSKPLDPAVRAGAEARLGQDFSRVRIHDDEAAAASADAMRARAYTVGSHIAFGRGEYRPDDLNGRRIVLHELVHVAQQRGADPTAQSTPRWLVSSSNDSEREARDVANGSFGTHSGRPSQSWQPSQRTEPCLARYPKEGEDLQGRESEALQHGQDPYHLPPKTDPLQPLQEAARKLGPISPAQEPTIPGSDAQQQEAIALINPRDLFEQPEIQQRLRAIAVEAEAREAAALGAKGPHTVAALMSWWEDRFADSVFYILYQRVVTTKPDLTRRGKMIQRLEQEEAKLIRANPPDLINQVETLRKNLGAEWRQTVQHAADRFVTLAENEAKFATVHQRASEVRVWGLPDTMEGTTTAAAHPGVLEPTAADVAQSVVTFMTALQKESKIKAVAENYRTHELGTPWLGGDKTHVGKYSFDVHLDQFVRQTPDGFYDRDAVVKYFLAADRVAKATGIEWIALFNDFEVAKAVNEQLGALHVGFSGGGGDPPGSFHHGPEPYILHIHFSIMPLKLKEKFDQLVALKKIAAVVLPFIQHFNPP